MATETSKYAELRTETVGKAGVILARGTALQYTDPINKIVGICAAPANFIGFAKYDYKVGDFIAAVTYGESEAIIGGAVSENTFVTINATGQVVSGTAANAVGISKGNYVATDVIGRVRVVSRGL